MCDASFLKSRRSLLDEQPQQYVALRVSVDGTKSDYTPSDSRSMVSDLSTSTIRSALSSISVVGDIESTDSSIFNASRPQSPAEAAAEAQAAEAAEQEAQRQAAAERAAAAKAKAQKEKERLRNIAVTAAAAVAAGIVALIVVARRRAMRKRGDNWSLALEEHQVLSTGSEVESIQGFIDGQGRKLSLERDFSDVTPLPAQSGAPTQASRATLATGDTVCLVAFPRPAFGRLERVCAALGRVGGSPYLARTFCSVSDADGDSTCLVTEYCALGDLRARLQSKELGRLSQGQKNMIAYLVSRPGGAGARSRTGALGRPPA